MVLDRCGRVVYQQTIHRRDVEMDSVQAAMLSAHLDEPCGPCHLPLPPQEDLTATSNGIMGSNDQSLLKWKEVSGKSQDKTKISSIANMYASSNVGKSADDIRLENPSPSESVPHTGVKLNMPRTEVEETRDENKENVEEKHPETTKKPEPKKSKNKRKKGKHEKAKMRKRVDKEVVTSTSKPVDVIEEECNCRLKEMVGRDIERDQPEGDGRDIKDCGCGDGDGIKEESSPTKPVGLVKECDCRLQENVARDAEIDPSEGNERNTHECECNGEEIGERVEVDCNCRMLEMIARDIAPGLREDFEREKHECECEDLKESKRVEDTIQETSPLQTDQMPNEEDNLVIISEINTEDEKEVLEILVESPSTEATFYRSRIVWPMDKQDLGRDKTRGKKQRNMKQNQMDIQQEIKEGMEIMREDQSMIGYPDLIKVVIETEENVLDEIERVDEGMALRIPEEGDRWDQGAENGFTREEGDSTFGDELDGLSLKADEENVVTHDLDITIGEIQEEVEQSTRELVGENVWRQDKMEQEGKNDKRKQKNKQEKSKDIVKKGKKKDDKQKRVEKVEKVQIKDEEKEENIRNAWMDTDEVSSQEFVLRWPSEETERDEDPKPWPIAKWKVVTIRPTVYDPRSISDSEDQSRRLKVYAPEDDTVNGKDNLLHSKAQPWASGKH